MCLLCVCLCPPLALRHPNWPGPWLATSALSVPHLPCVRALVQGSYIKNHRGYKPLIDSHWVSVAATSVLPHLSAHPAKKERGFPRPQLPVGEECSWPCGVVDLLVA